MSTKKAVKPWRQAYHLRGLHNQLKCHFHWDFSFCQKIMSEKNLFCFRCLHTKSNQASVVWLYALFYQLHWPSTYGHLMKRTNCSIVFIFKAYKLYSSLAVYVCTLEAGNTLFRSVKAALLLITALCEAASILIAQLRTIEIPSRVCDSLVKQEAVWWCPNSHQRACCSLCWTIQLKLPFVQ